LRKKAEARCLAGRRNSKAPFNFVVQIMIPGAQPMSLTIAWAADYDPAAVAGRSGNDSESEDRVGPFDLAFAR
jgi:hypothetical protein